MSKEALSVVDTLKLALEALKQIDAAMPFPVAKLAIKKAEEALAQPEQGHPQAWLVYAKGSRRYFTLTFDIEKVPEIYKGGEAVPLCTTPPQRTWVGLTEDETAELVHRYAFYELTRQIEAKLKEKNT